MKGHVPTPAEIKAMRKAAGLTQTEAGAKVYTELKTWQDWEYGRYKMHPAFWELFQEKIRHRLKHSPE